MTLGELCDIIRKYIYWHVFYIDNESEELKMAEKRELVSGKYLEYRGWPLVREENTICYGDMNERCILILEIMSYNDKNLPDKILIQIVDSKDTAKIIRQGVKSGLYEAFNLGVIWLDHECSPKA